MSIQCEDGTLYKYDGCRHPNDTGGGANAVGECEHCKPTNRDGVGCDLLEELDAIRERQYFRERDLNGGVLLSRTTAEQIKQTVRDASILLTIVNRAFAKPRPERVVTPLPVDPDAIPF